MQPYCTLQTSGTGSKCMMAGSFVARTISSSGSNGFHFDEALLGAGSGAGAAWKPTGWLELQSAARPRDGPPR